MNAYRFLRQRFLLPAAVLAATVITTATVSHAADTIKILIIGDSTVQTYEPSRAVRGWGQYFGGMFTSGVTVVNHAMSGRSTKTFIQEGRWDKALAEKPGYVLIQFGHNDSHAKERPESTDAATDFREYLRRYIDDSRNIGAVPVLVTPMHRRRFKDGVPTQELLPYTDAMKAVARERNVPLIDLHTLSGNVLSRLGDDGSADLYVSPDDRTHFSGKGARLMARLVADSLIETVPALAEHRAENRRLLRHVVLFKFRDGTSAEDVKKIENAFRALPEKIDVIHDFEWGADVSVENKAEGYTHCFVVTFLSEEDRDAYLPHPAHREFGKVLGPHRDKVLVIDFWADK